VACRPGEGFGQQEPNEIGLAFHAGLLVDPLQVRTGGVVADAQPLSGPYDCVLWSFKWMSLGG